ncbi:MAG: hypothetical protein QOH99_1019 [Frankiaceae bacterium]|nr:hypothetical protein [Frankiaceae bacterium]
MAKSAPRAAAYRCTDCGLTSAKWVGRCPECQAWGTVAEVGAGLPARAVRVGVVTTDAVPIGHVDLTAASFRATGIDEFDRVLGGGIVDGSVLLLAGEPGVGKSTLLLEVAARCARPDLPALVVTGEESAAQVRMRAARVGALNPHLFLAAENDVGAVLAHIDAVRPGFIVLDSVQTFSCAEVDGSAGSVTQVRAVATALIRVAKDRGIPTVLVGHVTKDGSIAGPRVLEHLVDVVLQFEGERNTALRVIRAVKNRYGPADEIGCFEITETGLVGLADPSGLFLSRSGPPAPGSCITVTLEGRRPLIAEVQALVAATPAPTPRRATSGLDSSRVAMVLAVLERRAQLKVSDKEVYASTVGGVRLAEPATDLALALAIASSITDRPLPDRMIVLGEVGLAGEIRRVSGVSRRLAEAARQGYTRALVPPGSGAAPAGMRVTEVADIREALVALARSPRVVNVPTGLADVVHLPVQA